MAVKNLYQRNSTWYYRKIVPNDLWTVYGGCKDLRGSLGTKDKREAERRLHTKLAELDAEFERHRKARQEAVQQLEEEARRAAAEKAFLASPAFQQAVRAVKETTAGMYEIYETGEHHRHRAPTYEEAAAWVDAKGETLSPTERELAILRVTTFETVIGDESPKDTLAVIEDALALNNYERVSKTSFVDGHHEDGEARFIIPDRFVTPVRDFLIGLLDAERKSLEAKREALLARRQEDTKTGFIEELYDDWVRERNPKETTKSDVRMSKRLFEEANGPLRFKDISPQHVITFKNHLLSLDRKAQTKSKLWSMLRVVFSHAVGNQKIAVNPFDGITFKPAEDGVARSDFSKYELTSIFAELKTGQPDWWLFRLCLYTGARLGEIHQLTRADVRTDDGVLYLNLAEGEGQSLKTENSRRVVPLHRQLIADGFEEFLPEAGRLFQGGSAAASKRLNRAIKAAGITDEGKVVHSARHTFKSACRDAGLDEDTHDRLTGHRSSHVGRSYGKHSIASLKAAIDKIGFGIETGPV